MGNASRARIAGEEKARGTRQRETESRQTCKIRSKRGVSQREREHNELSSYGREMRVGDRVGDVSGARIAGEERCVTKKREPATHL